MKRYSIVFFILLISFVSYSQDKSFAAFIPRDYDTLDEGLAKGDLNKDGIEDIVLALYHKAENQSIENSDEDSLPPRILMILFGTKSGYSLSAKSSKAILCKDCGGVFGDPFAGIEIQGNVLIIYHYGGSAWRWGYTHKFRYQSNDWFLIGSTRSSYWNVKECEKLNDMAGTDYEDVNFLTGQYEKKRISEDCELLENKKGKRNVKPLTPLSKFTIEN